MAGKILATSSKTIIDITDGKKLTVYLGSNQPKTQIKDSNSDPATYSPNWVTSNLIIKPEIYAGQKTVSLNDSRLSITWRRRDGGGTETNLSSDETVTGNTLKVSANKLGASSTGILTYIARVSYNDPDVGSTITATADITFTLVVLGQNAKTISINGEQVFKTTATGYNPTVIQLTATVNNTTFYKWQYKNSSGYWMDYPTNSDNTAINKTTLKVKPDHNVFINNIATIRASANSSNVYDTISIYKISDGTAASIAFLTNESLSFVADENGKTAQASAISNVVAYTGNVKTLPTVGTPTGAPEGMTARVGTSSNNEVQIIVSVAANSTLGGTGERRGQITIPVTSPVATNLVLNWSKINTGKTGETGENAVVFSLYAPYGTVFVNGTGELEIQSQGYDGPNHIASASYQWYKFIDGDWSLISGQTSSKLTVHGEDVPGQMSFKCVMRYKNKDYTDIITLVDKTDNYQLEPDSTSGNIFKNKTGSTCLVARLWQGGKEVDVQKSTVYAFAENEPSLSSSNEEKYYYQIQRDKHETKLMRSFNGGAYSDVTNSRDYSHQRIYKWYRRSKTGDVLDNGQVFATGKVIYVTDKDVDVKTVFVCDVEQSSSSSDLIASGQYTITDLNDGIGILSTTVLYCVSSSPEEIILVEPYEGDGWSPDAPHWTDSTYVWSKTVTVYDDDDQTTRESDPVCITGNHGVGVESIEAEYYLSDSNTEQIGNEWKVSPDQWEMNKYLWTRTKITYSNGEVIYTTPYCDSSWEAINNVVIGGRNYIQNSKNLLLEGVHMLLTRNDVVGVAIVGVSIVS